MKHALEFTEHDTKASILVVAERLFAEIGFQKTTVSDIARELRMSPANVYRFYASKSDINESVATKLLKEMEASVADSVIDVGPPSVKLRAFIAAIEKATVDRYLSHRKLHELVELAFTENWPIVQDHFERITKMLAEIIAEGARAGEFHAKDSDLAAILLRSACMRFCHPRLLVECAQDTEPTVDQMVDFCIAALANGLTSIKIVTSSLNLN
jgi:AcrR family transcriptional regulator